MDLIESIRFDRARQRKKQPYKRNIFHTVSCIVKEYDLDKKFLDLLPENENYLSLKSLELRLVKEKKLIECPPFCLASRERYELASAIAGKLDNPYLQYARTPEEMLLSAPLYQADPFLSPRVLLTYDFETLLTRLRAEEELARLKKRLLDLEGGLDDLKETHKETWEQLSPRYLNDRLDQLQTFISKVELKESRRK